MTNKTPLALEQRQVKAERFYLVGRNMLNRNIPYGLKHIRGSALMGHADALDYYGKHLIASGFPVTGAKFISVGAKRRQNQSTAPAQSPSATLHK